MSRYPQNVELPRWSLYRGSLERNYDGKWCEYEQAREVITRLEALVERMKCCDNCAATTRSNWVKRCDTCDITRYDKWIPQKVDPEASPSSP